MRFRLPFFGSKGKARNIRNSGYGDAGASHIRKAFKRMVGSSKSPLWDIDMHNGTLRSRARFLSQSAPMATAALKAIRTSVVGPGLHLHAQVDKKYLGLTEEEANALNKEIEAEFELWAGNKRTCTNTGLQDFYEFQQLALLAWKTSGDAFIVFDYEEPSHMSPYGLRVRLIEADRVSTPMSNVMMPMLAYGINTVTGNKIFDGVEVSETGLVVAYHLCNTYPEELTSEPREWVRIDAVGKLTGLPNILHLMDAERPEQYRGITILAPVIENILQLNRYINATVIAALLEASLGVYIKKTGESDGGMPGLPSMPGLDGDSEEDEERDLADFAPSLGGNVAELRDNEDIVTVDPKNPGNNFDPFVQIMATMTGAAIGVPADVLLKRYNTSYSAARAALQDHWREVRMMREWFNTSTNRLIYEVWFSEAAASGRIDAPGFFDDPRARAAYLAHDWVGPAMPHIDPYKEAVAMEIMTKWGWTTHTQATTQLNGGDHAANVEQLKNESELLAPILTMLAAAVDIKKLQEFSSDEQEAHK